MKTPATERAGSVEFRVLGSVEVVADGQRLDLDGRKSREALAFLLLHANEPVASNRLIDALWGDDAPATADASLRVAISKLRKALEPVGARQLLETRPTGYVLSLDLGLIDANRFEALVAQGRLALEHGRCDEASTCFDEALALWRGDAFAEISDVADGATEQKRLASLRLDVEEDLCQTQLALGRHDQLVPELEALVDQQPTRERRVGQLMLALYRAGRQAEALDVYSRTRARLNEELGLEPGPELRGIQQAILNQSASLDAPTRQRERPVAQSRAHRSHRRIVVGLAALVTAVLVGVVVATMRSSSDPIVPPADSLAVLEEETGRVVAAVPVGARPVDVVIAGSAAWVTNVDDRTITRVDLGTREVLGTIGLGFEPTGLAASSDAVWVVGGWEHALWRIDADDGLVRLKVRFRERLGPLPTGYEVGPAGVAVDEHGVWVSHGLEVTLFDERTGAVEATITAGGPWAPEIAAGEDRVWVAFDNRLELASSDSSWSSALDVVDPEASARVDRLRLVGSPSDVEVGDGFVFVAIPRADAVWRFDTNPPQLDGTMESGDDPRFLVVDGAVWVVNAANATVTELDPSTGETLAVHPVGHTLGGIAAANGELWVAVRSP